MAAVNRVYVARLAGMVVLGPDGESIGRVRDVVISIGIASLFAILTPSAEAAFSFMGVAAGDASSTTITLWARAVDDASPAAATVTMQLAIDRGFSNISPLPAPTHRQAPTTR